MTDAATQSSVTDRTVADLERVGYAVLTDALSEGDRASVRQALAPHFSVGPKGRNPFEGYATQRVYGLVTKSRAFDPLVLDPTMLAVAEQVLGANFLLTASLAINIQPGEKAQALHFDDGFYRIPRPRPAVSLSVLWAMDPFTAENGATVVCPGSHRWGDSRPSSEPDTVPVLMPAGAAFVYLGTLVHAGGPNASNQSRLGISVQYAAAWARQQENFMIELGIDGALALPERLQELIGYSIHPPFMGMVDGRHPRRLLEAAAERADDSGA